MKKNSISYADLFRVKPGQTVRLSSINLDFSHGMKKDEMRERTQRNVERLSQLQELMFAENKHSLLACLQAIDAGGKDGTIRSVFGPLNPLGCRAVSFKQPTSLELAHDYMWRVHKEMPARGEMVVFNRSHYEDVLVVRVKNLAPKAVWSQRYDQINKMEDYFTQNGTHILKFFLHISKDEQLERFADRLNDKAKQWKISESDYSERELWSDYQKAFEDMLGKCSTAHAPWFVIPANSKTFRNLAISQILVDYMEGLRMKMPTPSVDVEQIRKKFIEAKAKKRS